MSPRVTDPRWPLVARIKNVGAAQMVDSSLTCPTSGTFIRAAAQSGVTVGAGPVPPVSAGWSDQTRLGAPYAVSMPTIVNVDEAKTRLSALLALVEAGEEVIIARNGRPVARLAPLAARAG